MNFTRYTRQQCGNSPPLQSRLACLSPPGHYGLAPETSGEADDPKQVKLR